MAWDFDGSNDYMQSDLGANYDVPITIAAWVNLDALGSRSIIGIGEGGVGSNLEPNLSMRIDASGFMRATTTSNVAATVSALSTGTFTTGTWVHGAARFASSTSRIAYLNGVAGTENQSNRATGGLLDTVVLGTGSGGTQWPQTYTNGRIAEAAIWTVALDASEIAALAAGYRPSLIRPDKLLWYAPLIREVQDLRGAKSITNNATAVEVHPRRIG